MTNQPEQKKSSMLPVALGVGFPAGVAAYLYFASKKPLNPAQLKSVMAGQSPGASFPSTAVPGSVKVGERAVSERAVVGPEEFAWAGIRMEDIAQGKIPAPETIKGMENISKYIEQQMTPVNMQGISAPAFGVNPAGKSLLGNLTARDVTSSLERLREAAVKRGARDVAFSLTPGWGLTMTMAEHGRPANIQSINLPLIFGHRGFSNGVGYSAGAYYVGGNNITHFQDALTEMTVMKSPVESGFTGFVKGIKSAAQTMTGTLRGVADQGIVSQVEAVQRGTLYNLPLAEAMGHAGGVVGPWWKTQFPKLFPGISFSGITSAHEGKARVLAHHYSQLPASARASLGITAAPGTVEYAHQVGLSISALGGGGEHIMQGMMRMTMLGTAGLFPSTSYTPLQSGGRILRQAALARSPEYINKMGGGILGTEHLVGGVGAKALQASSKLGSPANVGFAARGMYVVSPGWAAAMGMDPVAGGGAVVASARAQEAMLAKMHVGFRIPVKNNKIMANPKITRMIMEGTMPTGGVTMAPGEMIGVGEFFSHDKVGQEGVARFLRTRGEVKFTKLPKLAPGMNELVLEGEMAYHPETVSLFGKHASIATGFAPDQMRYMSLGSPFQPGGPISKGAMERSRRISELLGGKGAPVEILANLTEAKPEEVLHSLYQSLVYDAKDPNKALNLVENALSAEKASMQGYLKLAKDLGVKPLYDEKTGKLATQKVSQADKQELGRLMGWGPKQIEAFAKQELEVLPTVMQIRPSQFPSEFWPGLISTSRQPSTIKSLISGLEQARSGYTLTELTPAAVMKAEQGLPIQYRMTEMGVENSLAAMAGKNLIDRNVINDFIRGRQRELTHDIGQLHQEIQSWHIMKQTTHPVSLGWRELSMITDREGYQELAQHLISSMKSTEGTAGKEFMALFGQFGFMGAEGQGVVGGIDPRSLAHAGGAYETIQLGSEKLRIMGKQAEQLKTMIQTEGLQAAKMSELYKTFDRGFMLETGGKQIQVEMKRAQFGGKPVSVGSVLAGATQPIYVPGLAETVPKSRIPGDIVFPEKILGSKLDLMIALGGYYDIAAPSSKEVMLKNVGAAMSNVLAAHATMLTKKGGGKDIAGLQYIAENTAFGRAAGHEIVPEQQLLAAIGGATPEIRAESDPLKYLRRLQEANAATMFISPEAARTLPELQYQKLTEGRLYGMAAKWPTAMPRSMNVVKIAVATTLSQKAMAVSRSLRAFMGMDLDGDAIAAWIFGNSKAEDNMLEKAYNVTLKEAQILERQYDEALDKAGGADTIRKTLSDDIISKTMADRNAEKELFDMLVKAKGPEGALEHVIAGKIAQSTYTGYVTNQMTLLTEMINMQGERAGANKAATSMAKDVLGTVVTEANIRMAKHAAAGTEGIIGMAAYQLQAAMGIEGGADATSRGRAVQKVLDDINAALWDKGTPTAKALIGQFKSETGKVWGLPGMQEVMKAGPTGVSPVADVLVNAELAREQVFGKEGKLSKLVTRGFLFGRLNPGSEDIMTALGHIAIEPVTPMEKLMRATMVEEGMINKPFLANIGAMGRNANAAMGVGGTPFKGPAGAARTMMGRVDEMLGKVPEKWWPTIAMGAAATLGIYALGRTVGAFRQPPPQPEGVPQQSNAEPQQQQVYVKGGFRSPFQQVPGNQRVEIRQASGNIDMLRQMMARSGSRLNISDNSSTDQEFQHRLSQDQSSRFRGL